MKNIIQKDWKDILWEKMSKEEKEKPSVFNKKPIKKAKKNLV
jgi:hypothetical protein|tara:strand:- start:64 stop:189 length:126 start_codon:yes stop_codon:yes gene_type:complete